MFNLEAFGLLSGKLVSGSLDLCSPDPGQFRASFQRFMAQFSEQLPGGVEVNGRGFGLWFDRASGGSRPVHDQRLGSRERRLVLAETATVAKSNQIGAIPKSLMNLQIGSKPERFDSGQQIRTELGVGSSLLPRDQSSPNSVDI